MATAQAEIEIGGKEYELYPMGAHLAQVIDVALDPPKNYPDPQLRWKLDLPDIETQSGDPATVYFYTPVDATPKNKLGRMLLALGKNIPRPGEKLKASSVIGSWGQAVLMHKMTTDGSGAVTGKITEILPITPKQRAVLIAQKVLAADAPEPATAAQPALPATNAADVQAQVTAGEDAKAAAIDEFRPILIVLAATLEETKTKLSADNTGPGLKALAVAKKAQKVDWSALDYSLVSIATIKLAQAEALALIEKLRPAPAVDDDTDPFADE